MNKLYIFLFTVFFSTQSTSAQKHSSDEEKIHKVLNGFFEGFSELNIDKVKPYCASNFVLLEDGSVWNIDTLATKFIKTRDNVRDFRRVNSISLLDTKTNKNMAWTYYNNQATIQHNGKAITVNWLESAVLNKVDNDWKIVLLHSTFVNKVK